MVIPTRHNGRTFFAVSIPGAGSRVYRLSEAGYEFFAPKIAGWECFFVARHSHHTVWSFRPTS